MKHLGTPTLIGLPYDGSSSFLRGAAAAPDLIREALFSPASNLWSEAGIDLGRREALADAGDLPLEQDSSARGEIEAGVQALLDQGGRPISLGGDHSVTYPILRALGQRWAGLTVLQFDAHPDLYAEFEGDRYSHACPFARIMEEGLAAHLAQVGIRGMNGHQREQASRYGVEVVDMPAFHRGIRPNLQGPLYVSFDLDALDPAFAPGVSHREPGGLSVREALALIQSLPGPLVGADVVEYNPRQDLSGMTAVVAAKLVKELAGRMLN